ncbi:hypothetical protein ACLOJK_013707 [Asimina triloba]
MTSLRVLEFMYKMKKLHSKTFRRSSLSRRRLLSGLSKTYHPNHQEMREVFDKIDKDRDGKISEKDLAGVLSAVQNVDMENEMVKAEEMVKAADLDGDGCISFQEFMDVHEKCGHASDNEIKLAFHMCDLDRDGRIGVDDLLTMLRRLGEASSPEACRRMISSVDTDGDGLVDFQDFVLMMTKSMKPVH